MSIKRALNTFAANSKGNVAIMTAITLPIAIGFARLGAETGLWWYKERQLQASVDLASYAGAVVARAGGSGPHPLSAGKYCGGLNLSGDYTLNPGVYVISGGTLRINSNANVSGSGVTFYLTNNADVRFNGTADIDLAAPTSGTYEGLLFIADPTSSGTSATFDGSAVSRLQGGLYFPDQHAEFLGDFSASNGCTRIVARTIEIRGNPNFSSNCTGTGLSVMAVPGAVRLVERGEAMTTKSTGSRARLRPACQIARFWQHRGGNAAVEFGFIAPSSRTPGPKRQTMRS